MRRALLPAFFSMALAVCTTQELMAQNDKFAYAITDLTKEGGGWTALRRLDLQSGQYSDVLINGMDATAKAYDAVTKKELAFKPDPKYGNLLQTPFSNGVAAAAFDRKNNRIYFTPMFVDQLRYIDLRTLKVYYVTGKSFSGMGNMHNDEGKIITRMVIAPDGYGYAISNDGNTFIRFSTGKKMKIEQLGALVDDPANNSISIHNRCTSFGGDMISDDNGNLYILSARNNVFKINTETKVATHVAAIKGLPAQFTVNGAAVDGDGNLLVSSAVDASAYYSLNANDWTAVPFTKASGIFRASDLANSNYLTTASRGGQQVETIAGTINTNLKAEHQISVYPNPVRGNTISVQFNKVPAGNYVLEMRDVLGRNVQQQRITVNGENQVQTIVLKEGDAKGVYMVSVVDGNSQSVFNQKLVVQ